MKKFRISLILVLVLGAVSLVSRPVHATPIVDPVPLRCVGIGAYAAYPSGSIAVPARPMADYLFDYGGACLTVSTHWAPGSRAAVHF